MNELHESRSKQVKTPKRKCELTVREALADIDPSSRHGSVCERLDSFTDATLLKVIGLAHQKLVSVHLEACNLDIWDGATFQCIIDLVLEAFNTASASVWREEIVRLTKNALCGYHRALGEVAYQHFVRANFPDGVPFGAHDDDVYDGL